MSMMQSFLTPLRAYLPSARARHYNEPEPVHSADDGKDGDSVSISRPFPAVTKDKKRDSPDKRERDILEKLSRFARVPAPTIFDLEPGSSSLGLSAEAARAALERHGPNIFATDRAPSDLVLFVTALANPFNFILTALAIVSIATGDKATFIVMLVMVVASTCLRYIFASLFFLGRL
jgi:magnesium-transporting ATPase (P-type)